MGRHRRRQRATIGDTLRRIIWAPTDQQTTDHAQLSLLSETTPLRPTDQLAPLPVPRHRAPEPPQPATTGRPSLAVVRDDNAAGHAPATVCVATGDDVHLCYPDGSRIPIDWHADRATSVDRRYVADVPSAATLTPGMVIQAGPIMVPVRFVDDPPPAPPATWDDDWVVGGGRRP